MTEGQMKQLEELAKPLNKWLNDNTNPYSTIIVDCCGVQLMSCEYYVPIKEFIKD